MTWLSFLYSTKFTILPITCGISVTTPEAHQPFKESFPSCLTFYTLKGDELGFSIISRKLLQVLGKYNKSLLMGLFLFKKLNEGVFQWVPRHFIRWWNRINPQKSFFLTSNIEITKQRGSGLKTHTLGLGDAGFTSLQRVILLSRRFTLLSTVDYNK